MPTSEITLGPFLIEQNVFSPHGAPPHLDMAQFQRFLEAGRGQAGVSGMLETTRSCPMQQLYVPPDSLKTPTHSVKVLAEVMGAPLMQKAFSWPTPVYVKAC